MKSWQTKEIQARRAIEDQGFVVQDANVLFRANCPNIDLVVFSRNAATYVQVKASEKPAQSDAVIVDGSPWTEDQLRNGGPIFNKHDGFRASLILIVASKAGETEYYIAPPAVFDELLVPRKSLRRPSKKRRYAALDCLSERTGERSPSAVAQRVAAAR